jgi:hypothetical protein
MGQTSGLTVQGRSATLPLGTPLSQFAITLPPYLQRRKQDLTGLWRKPKLQLRMKQRTQRISFTGPEATVRHFILFVSGVVTKLATNDSAT